MNGINKVIIVGHLGGDPEIKKAGSVSIANITVATSEKYNDKASGEAKQITEWHKIVLFNKLADIAGAYLTKGASVYIEGKLKTEKYKDKDGIDRYATKIIGNSLQMLGGKTKTETETETKVNPDYAAQDEKFDDDIPF
jgi:single-strand DNA-binding protein